MPIKIATNEQIISEDFAKKNFFIKAIVYGKTHMGKTHLALSSFFLDRGDKENVMFVFPTDTIQNIEEVLKKLFTKEELKRIYSPRDEEGVMKRLTNIVDIRTMLDFVLKFIEQNPNKHPIIVVDTADGIEDIYLEHLFSQLHTIRRNNPNPIPADYGKARTDMLINFVMPLMDLKADVIFITSEEDIYATEFSDGSPYVKPTGLLDITLGGSSRRSKDKFKRPFNMIFHLSEIAPYDIEKRKVINIVEKIKLSDNPNQWFKPIKFTGNDCNDMRRIFKEILYRQQMSRDERLKNIK